MTSHTAKQGEKHYHYYRCHRGIDYRRHSCRQRMARAEKAEAAMWEFVSRAMKNPERILVGMDALIEQKRAELRGDPDREAKVWIERLAEVDQEQRGYLRLAAKGRMTEGELDEALADLEETRRMAERELEAIGGRREEIEQLERDRDALRASWAAAVSDNLDRLSPEGRNTLYHKLRLEFRPTEDGYEVIEPFCSSDPLSYCQLLHKLQEKRWRSRIWKGSTRQPGGSPPRRRWRRRSELCWWWPATSWKRMPEEQAG